MNRILLTLLAGGVANLDCDGQQPGWTQWRGPARDGQVPDTAVPDSWPRKLRRIWQLEVGNSHTSPVTDGERAFTLTRRADAEVVTAIGLTDGEQLWQQTYPVQIGINQYADKHGKWPRSTPLVHDGKLVTIGANATVQAWDTATGRRLWRREREQPVSTAELFCGTSTSPLLHGGRIVAHLGDDSGGQFVAFDLDDGELVWRTALEGPGYSSPMLAEIDGVLQFVTMTMSRVVSVSPDGELLWSEPFDDKWNENIITPVIHGDLVIVAGVRRGTIALRPRRGDDGWRVETAWANRSMTFYMSSPVRHDDLLLGFSQKRRGSLVALDVNDGTLLWSEPEPADNAALLLAGSHLVALTTDGELLVAAPTRDGLSLEHRYEVADRPTWGHPVPLGDGWLVKDTTSVSRWRVEESPPKKSPVIPAEKPGPRD